MSILFSPVDVGPITARNRAWVSPMCQYSSEQQDGMPGDWHVEHLASMARGGAGLVMTEATAVVPEGRISPWDTGIWNDQQADAWVSVPARIRAHGAVPAMQLAHAGRKASTHRQWSGSGSVPASEGGWETVAPSAQRFEGYAEPRAMTADELEALPEAFAAAARRAVAAGFEALEVHAAHGYLLHQLLSPLSNLRDDAYADGRAMLARVVRAVREAAPDAAVMVRLSASDWVPGGIDAPHTVETARAAVDAGSDWIDVSSGGLDARQEITIGQGYQVPFARAVREALGGAAGVNAVGMIDTAEYAERVLASGDADAVMLARPWLRNPHWALLAEAELDGASGSSVDGASVWPPQYTRARPRPSS